MGLVSTGVAIAVPAGTCKFFFREGGGGNPTSLILSLILFTLSSTGRMRGTTLPSPQRQRQMLKQVDGRVAPRSGLAVKHSITTGAGVVDYDYRGEVKVVLFNLSEQADFEVRVGDRVAQLVLERIVTPEVVEVEELVGTERGAGGFGSTGGFGAVGQRGSQRLVVVGNGGVKRKEVDDGEMDTGA